MKQLILILVNTRSNGPSFTLMPDADAVSHSWKRLFSWKFNTFDESGHAFCFRLVPGPWKEHIYMRVG